MKITIIGGGSFGTALAQVLARGNDVSLIVRNKTISKNINKKHINTEYFPNFILNKNIKAFDNYNNIVNTDIIILAIPSKYVLSEIKKIKHFLSEETVIINTAKGFSEEGKTILTSLRKIHQNCFSILGPTFATNLIRNEYSAFTVASDYKKHYKLAKKIFEESNVILDYSSNYRLIEMASILKNVFAIANGLYSAIDDSVNTKFAFLTYSYKEMNLILEALFENIKDDYYKYGVFGDLLLTSLNEQSRNKTFGQLIGRGFYKIGNESNVTLEGIKSTKKIYEIVRKKELNTPVINFVFNTLNGKNVFKEYNLCMKAIKYSE